MKIWVIGRSYPQKSNNMQGSFELEQAKMLSKYGNEVAYIACVFHPFKKVKKRGFYNFVEDDVEIFTYSQIFAIERMKIHLEFFKKKIWKKLLDNVDRHFGLPDVIHVHYPSNITIASHILSYKYKGCKIVCTEHWSQVLNNQIDSYELNQLKNYVNHADSFLAVSLPLKSSIEKLTGSSNVNVVPNMYNSIYKPYQKQFNSFTFVAVGALTKNKQFDKIILSFYKAFKNNKNIKLIIIGNGPDFKRLEKIVKTKRLSNQVIFKGLLSREETSISIAKSNVLLSYSKFETFCVPIIEAWACGLPVVATDSISVNENWDDRLGYKIKKPSLSKYAQNMRKIFNNYDSFDKKYIRQYAIKNYSEETIYKKLKRYY